MAERIDKARLQTDLRYRFDYLSDFIDFTQNDIRILNQLEPIIIPHLSTIVEKVYKKLYSYDITKEYFLMPHDGFEHYSQHKDHGKTFDAIQVDYRKDMLSVFLTHVLSQPEWNDAFLEYLSRVGEIHTNKGGASSINVDYIHINALLSILENIFMDIILNTKEFDIEYKHKALHASSKFFWIQNHFFTMQYNLALNEKNIKSSVHTVHFSKCFFR